MQISSQDKFLAFILNRTVSVGDNLPSVSLASSIVCVRRWPVSNMLVMMFNTSLMWDTICMFGNMQFLMTLKSQQMFLLMRNVLGFV